MYVCMHVLTICLFILSYHNSNSLFASFNVGYDHGDYRERVFQNEKFFTNLNLNDLYKDSTLTGFDNKE